MHYIICKSIHLNWGSALKAYIDGMYDQWSLKTTILKGLLGGGVTEEKESEGEEKEKLLPFNYELHKLPHLNLTKHYYPSPNFTDKLKLKEAN